MRRPLPWLFNGLCLLSLLACVRTAWRCCRSAWRDEVRVRLGAVTSVWVFGRSRDVGLGFSRVNLGGPPAGLRSVAVPGGDDAGAPSAGGGRAVTFGRCLGFRRLRQWLLVEAGANERAGGAGEGRGHGSSARLSTPRWIPLYVCEFWTDNAEALALSSAAPLLWLAARSRRAHVLRRRRRLGLCPSCGYDLRATTGRCPECGTVPAKGAAT